MSLLDDADRRRIAVSATLDSARRIEFGQVFTPALVARFMASLFELRPGPANLLDPRAGMGQLSTAFADRWYENEMGELRITAVERDDLLHDALIETLARLPASIELIGFDYLDWACTGLIDPSAPSYDYVIMNPPYAKLGVGSPHRLLVGTLGVEVANLYAGFVTVAIRQLAPRGQLVAITPRSFANGPYFRAFRRDLLRRTGLRRIHVYDTRNTAFADAAVLQENVIFHVERDHEPVTVAVTSSLHPGVDVSRSRRVAYSAVVRPDDPDSFVHISDDEGSAQQAALVAAQSDTLQSLGVEVSTGRVVDFRCRERLRSVWSPGDAPLIYPTHLRQSTIAWPRPGRKANGLHVDNTADRMLLPSGQYVLIKRFSSKEERRRVVASLLRPDDLPGEVVAVENHLNVIHQDGHGIIDGDLALGLVIWLNSTLVDVAFRQFSGHTQVNATDLRAMRFPSERVLRCLGAAAGAPLADQDKIDSLVGQHVPFACGS